MAENSTGLDLLEASCRSLVERGEGLFSWEWDGRFGTALTTFESDRSDDVRALVDPLLPVSRVSRTMAEAPQLVQRIANVFGGLRGGQELLLSSEQGAPLLVGAWWPWGGGKTISLRIKLIVLGLDADGKDQMFKDFRAWFGIQ